MRKRPLCTICVLFLIAQAIRVSFFGTEEMKPSALERAVGKKAELTLEGIVYRIEEKAKVTAVFVKDAAVSVYKQNTGQNTGQNTDSGDGKDGPEQIREPQVLVYVRPELLKQTERSEVKIGNRIRIRGEGQCFESARNPGNFDQKAYYRRLGIYVLVWADSLQMLSDQEWRVHQFLSKLRSGWNELLICHLGEYYGGTMSAVLLGEKAGLDPEMKKMYQKNGISHLLAISGLHMSFIGMGFYGLLRRCGFGFVPAGILGGAVLLCYTLMIGAGVSSTRALIMFFVRIGADMTGRDYDLPTSLALAAAVLVWGNPLFLTDAGFLLSFGAILGITLLGPVFSETFGCDVLDEKIRKAGKREAVGRQRRKLRYRIQSLALWGARGMASSTAVSVLLLGPLLYFYFEVPPYSVFLNLLVIPVMPAAMGAGLTGSLLALFWEEAGGVVLMICKAVLWFYDLICAGAGILPGSRLVTGQPGVRWLVVYYWGIGIFCLVYRILSEQRRKAEDAVHGWEEKVRRLPGILILLFAAGMAVFCRMGYQSGSEIRVTVLDVGQGDGIHIGGTKGNYLIDGGSSDVSNPGTYRIEPYLLANAVDTLDYVFVTHGDEDHSSGLEELLEGQEMGVRIRCLVLPPEEYHDEKLATLASLAVEKGTRVTVMKAGEQIREEKLAITCLGPENELGLEPGNSASLVLDVSFGAFDMLLTGDVEGVGEKALIESGRLREYDVLKAAHHGSKNSGSEAFLRTVRPRIALISAGVDNRYGHPHKETTERLTEAGCRIYSTQERGAVTVWTDGEKMRVSSYLDH